jgi:ankyrin repeat protein
MKTKVLSIILAISILSGCSNTNNLTSTNITNDTNYHELKEKIMKHNRLYEENGDTLFISACKGGYKDLVEYLLDYNPILVDLGNKSNGISPLLYAIEYEKVEIVKLLIKYGADISKKNKEGITPLILASQTKEKEIIELLLGAKNGLYSLLFQEKARSFNINDISNNGGNALTYLLYEDFYNNRIIRKNNSYTTYEIAKILVDNGIDINKGDKQGNSPLTLSYKRDTNTFNLLIKNGANINQRNPNGLTLLNYTIIDNLELSKKLIDRGADINNKTKEDLNLLMFLFLSPSRFNEESVDFLLSKGFKLTEKNNKNQNLLHLSAMDGDYEKLSYLVSKKLDINEKDVDGNTPLLFLQTKQNYQQLLDLLLKKGADINAQNNNGENILMIAMNNPIKLLNSENEKYLPPQFEYTISKGIDINHKNKSGENILTYLLNSNYINLVKILISKGVDVNNKNNEGNTPLMLALKNSVESESIISLLLENGADINSKNNQNESPLTFSLLNKNLSTTKLILSRADITTIDIEMLFKRILSFEKPYSFDEKDNFIKLLLDKGFDINTKNKKGNTLLIESIKTRNLNLFKLLIQKKADINIKDSYGYTPLQITQASPSYDDLKYILLLKGSKND